jgi:DnaJ family protein A protein 2
MPTFKRPDTKGNLYVIFEVEFPEDGWLTSVDSSVRANFADAALFLYVPY